MGWGSSLTENGSGVPALGCGADLIHGSLGKEGLTEPKGFLSQDFFTVSFQSPSPNNTAYGWTSNETYFNLGTPLKK